MTRHIFTALALTAVLGVSAQTNTNLIIEETNGQKTSLPTSQITGVLFQDAPDYKKAPLLLNAFYATSGSHGVYTLELGTDQPDENGEPTGIGEMQVALQLIAPASADKYDAEIPEGYYRVGQSSSDYTININSSGVRTRTAGGEDGVSFQILMDGSVDVRRTSNGGYYIRVEMTAMDQTEVNIYYDGRIKFSTASSEYDSFSEDQNVTFTGGQERFYGNWYLPLAHDGLLQFYTGSFDPDGVQTEGYWLNIDTYMPKYDDPMNVKTPLPDGTYKVDPRLQVQSRTFNPFTCRPGETQETLGMLMQVGTYMTYLDKDGQRYLAHIRGGEFTVSNGGKKVTFDFVDENGTKITGSYDGTIVVGNFCDNDQKEFMPPYSTVTSDHSVLFADSAVALVYKEPVTFVLGYDTYQLYVMDSNTNKPTKDTMQFTILKKEGETLGNGTYTVGTGFGENVILPGRVEFTGNVIFSWYGDNDSADADGYQTVMAPLVGGTLTISDGPDANQKTLTFDLTDDANLGESGKANKFTGTWTGVYYIYDENDFQAPQMKRAK